MAERRVERWDGAYGSSRGEKNALSCVSRKISEAFIMGGGSSRLRTQNFGERLAVKGVQGSGRRQISDNFHHLPGV